MQIQKIYAEHTATITQAKANPNSLLAQAEGGSVAILANNKTRYYMVSPDMYEKMVDTLELYQQQANEQKGFMANFRPNKSRMDAITAQCAEMVLNSTDEALVDFKEW